MESHLSRGVATATLLAALAGCASVGSPIRPYGYDLQGQSTAGSHLSVRKRADLHLKQWDRALQELQAGNTAASILLPATAALIGLRAARSKSSAATAGLASAGLVGISIADAMLQLSRVNVYLEGIAAMECGTNAYDAVHFSTIRSLINVDAIKRIDDDRVTDAYRAFDDRLTWMEAPLDEALSDAITRITRDTNKALAGSIISVQSRDVGGSRFGQYLHAPPAPPPAPLAAMPPKALGAPRPPPSEADQMLKRIAEAQAKLDTDRAPLASVAVATIDACDFAATTASVERRPTQFILRSPGFEGKPIVLSKGESTLVLIEGGAPDFSAETLPKDAAKITAVYSKTANAHLIEIKAVAPVAQETFRVVVSEGGGAKRTTWIDVTIKP